MSKVFNCIIALVLLGLTSCGDSPKSDRRSGNMTKRELYRSALTKQDSVLSRELVSTFFEFMQNEKYADAVMMLHKLNADNPYATPELLGNDEIESTMKTLKQFKIQSYSINAISYESAIHNPARCTVFVNQEGGGVFRTTWELNPINYLGEWKLCFPVDK